MANPDDLEGLDGRPRPSRVEVLKRERLVDAFFKLDRIVVRYERFDGSMGDPLSRLLFERGDAAGVLLYDPDTWSVLLVRQFRYAAYARGDDPWLWEIVAGTQGSEDDPALTAGREAIEEAGYRVDDLKPVASVYLSPGASTERIHLFVAPVASGDRVAEGGGLVEEDEDILTAWISLDEAFAMVRRHEIMDAKTVICLQHLKLMRDGD